MSSKQITTKSSVPECYHFHYIENGYRSNYEFWDALMSLFTMHNETMNIWSHLIGFICVVIVGSNYIMDTLYSDIPFFEYVTLQTYIVCAALCLFLSTVYHWFGCLSEQCHDGLLKLDLTGVAFLVAGSFIPGAYFGKTSIFLLF